MGYDPFWPTYLAAISVLCVPASRLTSSRFDEIFQALKTVSEIDLVNLKDWDEVRDDSIIAPESQRGTILLDHKKAISLSETERFPLELNAGPQIVLGIYDGSNARAANDGFGQIPSAISDEVERANNGLQRRYGPVTGVLVCKLLCVDVVPTHNYGDDIIVLPNLHADSISNVATLIIEILKPNVLRAVRDIAYRPINSPQSSEGANREKSLPPLPVQTIVAEFNEDDSNAARKATPVVQGGRHSICCGMYCLQLGCWSDAIRHLSRGATVCRNDGDILWHAKAIESLLVAMALCTWKGIEFVIPEICISGKAGISLGLARSSTSTTGTEVPTAASIDLSKPVETSDKFLQIAPSITQLALTLYERLGSTSEKTVLPVLLTEARIRLLNFLIFIYGQRGELNPRNMEDFILRKQQAYPSVADRIAGSYNSSLPKIDEMLIESLPPAFDGLQSPHYLATLVAIVDSLSSLGLKRRHAFYFRDLLEKLVPVLIQARKVGASEAGVHPAAALSSSNTGTKFDVVQNQSGVRRFLDAAAISYGLSVQNKLAQNNHQTRLADVRAALNIWWDEQNVGDILLKLEILRLCVGVSDALPDLTSSLYFSSYLLRSTKQSITMSRKGTNASPSLSAEDQSRFLTGLKRTVSAAGRIGQDNLRAEYWDDFLVRGIELVNTVYGTNLTAHTPKDLSVIETGSDEKIQDPFLFNPFAKPKITQSTPTIVANERATFSVILQNPLEVEIELDDIYLLAEGCDFEPSHHSMVLGPFSLQAFSLDGIARTSGELRIRGCKATVNSCFEQDFLIFEQDWQPPAAMKQKQTIKNKRQSLVVDGTPKKSKDKVMDCVDLILKVIEPQPRIEIHAAKMIQPSLMLLEGEKKSINLTLTNRSREIPADFVLFTFDDNVTNELEEALGRKDIIPVDTYEIQHQMKFKSTIKAADGSAANSVAEIMPKKDATYAFEVYGRPGLVNATVQVDFTRLGAPRSKIKETFYTRQARFPISVTVNGSVEILRCNILPISGDFAWNARGLSVVTRQHGVSKPALSEDLASILPVEADLGKYCMLVLDLRNVWPQPLTVQLIAFTQNKVLSSDDISSGQVVEETLQPGLVSRVVLIVERVFVADPYAAIPNLGVQRQFVVSASKMTVEAEAATREAFWYREELLKRLSGTWREEQTGRHGEIDLRKGVRLNSRMIDALKIDHVDISFLVRPVESGLDSAATTSENNNFKQIGNSHFVIPTESFATLLVRVHNKTQDKLRLLLRLQPALRNQLHTIALDLSKRLLWSGVLQRPLNPAIEPGDTYESDLGIIALAEGEYEVNAAVEEIKGRTILPTTVDTDVLNMSHQRRIWHARSPCLIDALDETA